MRVLVAVLLLVAATTASAEWVQFASTEKITLYIDPASVRKDGNLRRVWELLDFRERGVDGSLSQRQLNEYDCKEERSRSVSITPFSGQMGTGSSPVVPSGFVGPWVYAAPGTIGEKVLRYVCAQ